MNYGLYLSASGIVANSYRQDVISNNLANSQTTGFKRDLATFYQRPTEAQSRGVSGDRTNPLLEHIGGGLLASPTAVDTSQGDLNETGNGLDVAIQGKGYFTVSDGATTKLTRNGGFTTDHDGNLVLSNSKGDRVLDPSGKPIQLDPTQVTTIGVSGEVLQNGKQVNQLGVFDVADPKQLTKVGRNMLAVPNMKSLVPSDATLHAGFLEGANVDPSTELVQLMDTQRQLEANANMIRYQDQMLDKLVNTVGRIG